MEVIPASLRRHVAARVATHVPRRVLEELARELEHVDREVGPPVASISHMAQTGGAARELERLDERERRREEQFDAVPRRHGRSASDLRTAWLRAVERRLVRDA